VSSLRSQLCDAKSSLEPVSREFLGSRATKVLATPGARRRRCARSPSRIRQRA